MKNSFYISLQKLGDSETIEKLRTNLWDEENRLRAVDITPDAEGVRPIAIYTYDAGGERILKHSNTSVSVYLNGKKVADTIQVDATLYPSGMLVAKLGNNGSEEEQTLAYTKHYYAGTQRVSSKIGTTENLGDYLYDWFTGGMGGPVDVIGSSFGVLENAEEGVVQVYEEFGIDPPTYDSSPVFIPVQSFIHGGNEVEQYYFHPDHLGSTSYITNLLGEVSQHIEYFAFGETFVEEHRSSNNSPYKFNGKELDEETGWYYYGARYYDPRISVWLSVDPLANVDYLMNNEAYINGEHNGGVFNSFNHNSYAYTYQNPVVLIDPNGKQAHFMHGTGTWNSSTYFQGEFENNFKSKFGSFTSHQWSGSLYNRDNAFWNGNEGRISAGKRIAGDIIKSIEGNIKNGKYIGKGIAIGGHSHGANVARVATKSVYAHLKQMVNDGKLDKMPTINLILVNGLVLDEKEYNFSWNELLHINVIQVDAKVDLVAGLGQAATGDGAITESYKDTDHLIEYSDQLEKGGCSWSNHCGQADKNVKVWYPDVEKVIKN